MNFLNWHQKTLQKISPQTEFSLWLRTTIFSLAVFALTSLFLYARRGSYSLFVVNKVFATTGLFLIGLSFALSGLCYFWNRFDTKIIYRKHLGLAGFAYVLVHVIISAFGLPQAFSLSYYQSHLLTLAFGLAALLIFTAMAAISNQYAAQELGGKRWRDLLRVGYLAYIFVVAHFTLLKYSEWLKWFSSFSPILPPLSLLGFVFALAVLILRLALWISLKQHQPDTNHRKQQSE